MNHRMEIYTSEKGVEVNVLIEQDTVWATQKQMAEIFETTPQNITIHLNKAYREGEIMKDSTCKDYLQVQFEGNRRVKRNIQLYNLDAVLSVGYRIHSKRGTQFRQWATQRLKEYLVEGVSFNELRLAQRNQEIQILHDGIRILNRVIEEKANQTDLEWLFAFRAGLKLLDDYDQAKLDQSGMRTSNISYPTRESYFNLVENMRLEMKTTLFGVLKDSGFDSAIGQIQQGLGDQDIYPSMEEKAAILLYLIVKNHAFVDGNKRIGAACFLHFLNQNNALFDPFGQSIISNEALASLTLLVATSRNDEMQTIKRLIMSILNRSNFVT